MEEATLLREILAEVQALRREVAALALQRSPQQRSLRQADRERVAPVWPLLAEHVASEIFSVASLRQAITQADDAVLAKALDRCGSSKRIGKLFSRVAGHGIEGWCLERVNEDSPALYRFKRLQT